MMFTHSRLTVDPEVADQVELLFATTDRGRGGRMGTWHGPRLRRCEYTWFQNTFDCVAASIGELKIDQWWFNCGQQGDEYRWHTHSPYPYAAVLYVKVPERSGGIEFRDRGEFQYFQPVEGDFLVFSGQLAHRVCPNESAERRVSVAFNLR